MQEAVQPRRLTAEPHQRAGVVFNGAEPGIRVHGLGLEGGGLALDGPLPLANQDSFL